MKKNIFFSFLLLLLPALLAAQDVFLSWEKGAWHPSFYEGGVVMAGQYESRLFNARRYGTSGKLTWSVDRPESDLLFPRIHGNTISGNKYYCWGKSGVRGNTRAMIASFGLEDGTPSIRRFPQYQFEDVAVTAGGIFIGGTNRLYRLKPDLVPTDSANVAETVIRIAQVPGGIACLEYGGNEFRIVKYDPLLSPVWTAPLLTGQNLISVNPGTHQPFALWAVGSDLLAYFYASTAEGYASYIAKVDGNGKVEYVKRTDIIASFTNGATLNPDSTTVWLVGSPGPTYEYDYWFVKQYRISDGEEVWSRKITVGHISWVQWTSRGDYSGLFLCGSTNNNRAWAGLLVANNALLMRSIYRTDPQSSFALYGGDVFDFYEEGEILTNKWIYGEEANGTPFLWSFSRPTTPPELWIQLTGSDTVSVGDTVWVRTGYSGETLYNRLGIFWNAQGADQAENVSTTPIDTVKAWHVYDVPGRKRISANVVLPDRTPIFASVDIEVTGVTSVNGPAVGPKTFALEQNYPNPFNPTTNITYSIEKQGAVSLVVYNLLGNEIARLVDNQIQTVGNHTISFDASNLSSGVYFYKLQTNNTSVTKKMLLMK